jgi:hypothetical protein
VPKKDNHNPSCFIEKGSKVTSSLHNNYSEDDFLGEELEHEFLLLMLLAPHQAYFSDEENGMLKAKLDEGILKCHKGMRDSKKS